MISIILPSIRPDKLELFIASLKATAVRDVEKYFEFVIDTEPADCVIAAVSRCFYRASNPWLWFSNDDLVSETEGWDDIFLNCVNTYKDSVALFYPNDGLFGPLFPCFPLVPKEAIKDLFPSPYQRYKVDDCIRDVIPMERRFYLGNVMMRHSNYSFDQNANGYRLPDGRIYLQDGNTMAYDHNKFISFNEVLKRTKILNKNREIVQCQQLAKV